MAHGKRYRAALEKFDRVRHYPVDKAVVLLKENAQAKFDETVEVALNLGEEAYKGRLGAPSPRSLPVSGRQWWLRTEVAFSTAFARTHPSPNPARPHPE